MCWNVTQWCSQLNFEKKKGRQKWHCFTLWLYGGASKKKKNEKTCQPVGNLNRQQLATLGEHWHWHQYILMAHRCEACPQLMSLMSSGDPASSQSTLAVSLTAKQHSWDNCSHRRFTPLQDCKSITYAQASLTKPSLLYSYPNTLQH